MDARHDARRKVGAPPGAVVYTGPRRDYGARLQLVRYGEDAYEELTVSRAGDLPALLAVPGVRWLNVIGVHDTRLLEELGQVLGLHPLTVEDLASLGQRPKVEEYEAYLFMVMRILTRGGTPLGATAPRADGGNGGNATNGASTGSGGNATTAAPPALRTAAPTSALRTAAPTPAPTATASAPLHSEQFSLVLKDGLLVTFQELETDPFGALRDRLRQAKGRIRKMGVDYLAYTLIDLVVDQYFDVLEAYGDDLEALEEEILRGPERGSLERINELRRDLLVVRRAAWPLRDVLASAQRKDLTYFSPEVATYLRDAQDHAVQVMDAVETQREQITGLHDVYLSLLSVRMNDVMKVLTVIATIFIPLTFLAGVYGTNFEFMPEYRLRWAYPVFWLVNLTLAGWMIAAFRRRGWL